MLHHCSSTDLCPQPLPSVPVTLCEHVKVRVLRSNRRSLPLSIFSVSSAGASLRHLISECQQASALGPLLTLSSFVLGGKLIHGRSVLCRYLWILFPTSPSQIPCLWYLFLCIWLFVFLRLGLTLYSGIS